MKKKIINKRVNGDSEELHALKGFKVLKEMLLDAVRLSVKDLKQLDILRESTHP